MTDEAGKKDFWQGRWLDGRTGWDLSGPHPNLDAMLALAFDFGLPKEGRVYSPGCGRAHDGAYLAGLGMEVVATDIVDEAIAEAKSVYDEVAGLTLAVDDALDPQAVPMASQDAVFDRAVLCALPAAKRPDYAQACAKTLKPGGLLLSFPFTAIDGPEGSGPPFALSLPELTQLLRTEFDLLHAEERPSAAVSGKILGEMLTIWRRREQD